MCGALRSLVHATHAERAPECLGWICICSGTVEEIKELLKRWKGLLRRFQTARGKGSEKTKRHGEKKQPKEEMRRKLARE